MKNILKLVFISVAALFVSCDSIDNDTSYLDNRPSQAYFVPGISGSLLVLESEPSTTNIVVGISEAKDFDRTFTVAIDPSSTAEAGVHYDAVLTNLFVPAGAVVANIPVTGLYQGATLEGNTLKLELTAVEDSQIGTRKVYTLNIMRSCPLSDDFGTGIYALAQTSGPNEFGALAFSNQNVTITSGASGARSFSAVYMASLGVGQPAMTFTFVMTCETVSVPEAQPTGLLCTQGAPSITLGPAATLGSFNASDSTLITVVATEFESDGGCGVAPVEFTFTLTKI